MRFLQKNLLTSYVVFIGDIVFPPNPDLRLVRDCNSLAPLHGLQSVNDVSYCLPYREPRVRASIHEAKFHHNRKAARLLGSVLAAQLATMPPSIIVPMPLSRARQRERGHNQVESVLQAVDYASSGHTLVRRALVRTAHTKPQTELPRAERLRNPQEAFTVKRPEQITDKRILLLDDVVTTGATMAAAQAKLARHNPHSITCLALAH